MLDGNQIRVREDREDTDTQRGRSCDAYTGRSNGPGRPSKGIKVSQLCYICACLSPQCAGNTGMHVALLLWPCNETIL